MQELYFTRVLLNVYCKCADVVCVVRLCCNTVVLIRVTFSSELACSVEFFSNDAR